MHKQVVVLSEALFASPKFALERSLPLVRIVVRTFLARILDMSFEVGLVGQALRAVFALKHSFCGGWLSRCGNLGRIIYVRRESLDRRIISWRRRGHRLSPNLTSGYGHLLLERDIRLTCE
jgi:hypothetical protein